MGRLPVLGGNRQKTAKTDKPIDKGHRQAPLRGNRKARAAQGEFTGILVKKDRCGASHRVCRGEQRGGIYLFQVPLRKMKGATYLYF